MREADEVLRLRRQQLVLLLDLRLQRRDLLDTAPTDLSFRRGSPWGSEGQTSRRAAAEVGAEASCSAVNCASSAAHAARKAEACPRSSVSDDSAPSSPAASACAADSAVSAWG